MSIAVLLAVLKNDKDDICISFLGPYDIFIPYSSAPTSPSPYAESMGFRILAADGAL
jgi:hypothetical protein